MTTPAMAKLYEAQHVAYYEGRKVSIYNPNNIDVLDLPVIYGFNNGGKPGMFNACLISEDGFVLGGHLCSSESYMLADLGILEDTRPDRHETFRKHYPNGYRMEFVSYNDVKDHEKLQEAFKLNEEKKK